MPWPIRPQPSTPTFLISTSLPPSSMQVGSDARARGAYMSLVKVEDRGAVRHLVLNRPDKRNAMNGELIQELGRGDRGGGRRRRRCAWWSCAARAPCSPPGMDLNDLRDLSENPEGLRRFRRPAPRLVEPARGDAEAHDLPDPRRGARRRLRAGAGLRLPHDGRGRGGRDHGGAGGPAARRGRLLAAARRGRARPREGADHDRQGDRRPRGAPDRLRQPDRARPTRSTRPPTRSPASCSRRAAGGRRWPSA